MERTLHFRENWLIFWGIWGEAELILSIWVAKENIFRELRYFLLGIWGDKCIIFRDQGSTDPHPWGGSHLINVICKEFLSRTLAELFQLLHKVYQRVSGKY